MGSFLWWIEDVEKQGEEADTSSQRREKGERDSFCASVAGIGRERAKETSG